MLNEKCLFVTNIFFSHDKNILVIKGLDHNDVLVTLDYSLFLNDIFITDVSFVSEFFIKKKKSNMDERAFECKQNLDKLKGVDLELNVLRLNIL